MYLADIQLPLDQEASVVHGSRADFPVEFISISRYSHLGIPGTPPGPHSKPSRGSDVVGY